MSEEQQFTDAIKKLREIEDKRENKRKFDQTIDLIVNLKEFEVKKHGFNVFVQLPHKAKEKKIAGFFEKDSKLVDVIKKDDFGKYKEKKDIKKLDIEIPVLTPRIFREYKNLSELKIANFKHKKIKLNNYSSRLHTRKPWTISWCIDCNEMD